MAARRKPTAYSEEMPLVERLIRARERRAAACIVDNLLRQLERRARTGHRGSRGVQLDLMCHLTDGNREWFESYVAEEIQEGLRAVRQFETTVRERDRQGLVFPPRNAGGNGGGEAPVEDRNVQGEEPPVPQNDKEEEKDAATGNGSAKGQ